MNIVLTGGSGFLGRALVAALTASGHRVSALSRQQGVDFSRLLEPADWLVHLQGCDAVINCAGIIAEHGTQRFRTVHTLAPIALFRACAQLGIRKVVQISALGADETGFTDFHISKRAADDGLRALDLDWFVLRPSLVYGAGGRSANLFRRLAALPLIPVIGDGQQQIQPIHVSDLVATVIHCLYTLPAKRTIDLVGAERVSFAQWLQRIRASMGLPPARLLRIPVRLALCVAYLGGYFNEMLQQDTVRMLQRGSWADVEPLAGLLGRMPLAVSFELFFADLNLEESSS